MTPARIIGEQCGQPGCKAGVWADGYCRAHWDQAQAARALGLAVEETTPRPDLDVPDGYWQSTTFLRELNEWRAEG